jgi:hypothetical protein
VGPKCPARVTAQCAVCMCMGRAHLKLQQARHPRAQLCGVLGGVQAQQVRCVPGALQVQLAAVVAPQQLGAGTGLTTNKPLPCWHLLVRVSMWWWCWRLGARAQLWVVDLAWGRLGRLGRLRASGRR